ncbi:MAG: hypothetical protein M1820_003956 [Bogoriella megaspora]|nr:MAG: hypothetical protein M1820_003956 [Bogoriella megaspora]
MPKSRGKVTQNKHENGLAAPGKRIGKPRSNGNLRAHANGSSSPPQSLPHDSAVTHPTTLPPAVDGPNGSATPAAMGSSATKTSDADPFSPSSEQTTFSGRETHAFESVLLGDATHGQGRMDDANGKITTPHIGDTFTLAATILKSCPLRDVIAILIILLQLPPTFLTIVHALYTLLTFVPPTTGPASLPSLHDLFHGSGGTPSLGTILAVDIVILLIWLGLWEPAQNYVLDLSQAVIAVSLGGAAAGKNGTTNAFLICAFIILASHLNRHNQVRYYGHHIVWATLSKISSGRIQSPTQPDFSVGISWIPRSWFNRSFAIHIFTQGLVRWIRRSLSHRDLPPKPLPTSSADPETGISPQAQRSNSVGADSNPDITSSASTDGRPPGQPPAAATGKEKESNAKRKRKQANLVRSLQPFWAALASTKVTVLKEMEQSQLSPDAIEADATDINHVGNANLGETTRVWVTEILPTEIHFQATAIKKTGEAAGDSGSGIDNSKPLYVRLNGANWASTRIYLLQSASNSEGAGSSWAGEIFGLTPLSQYYCEFVSSSDKSLISATSVTSPPAPTAEQASTTPAPGPQSLRPSSPTTTLRNSISAMNTEVGDLRNTLKKNRKDHKGSIGVLQKELANITQKHDCAGNNDDRSRQRILQLKQNYQRDTEETAEMVEQADALATPSETELEEYKAKKSAWKESQSEIKSAKDDLDAATKKHQLEESQIQADIASAAQRRSRLDTRLEKLNEQLVDRESNPTTSASSQLSKAEKEALHKREALQRDLQEGKIVSQIKTLNQEHDIVLQKITATDQKIALLQSYLPDPSISTPSVPTTPEGVIPGTGPGLRAFPTHASTFPSFGLGTLGNGTSAIMHREGRGRSSSMLSNLSGFTDDQDAQSVATTNNVGLLAVGTDPTSPHSQAGSLVVSKPMSPPGAKSLLG